MEKGKGMNELSLVQVNSLFSINGNPYDGKSFQGIQTIDHFYNWTLTKLIPGMDETLEWKTLFLFTGLRVSWYDGKPAWDMRGFMNDKVNHIIDLSNQYFLRPLVRWDTALFVKFDRNLDWIVNSLINSNLTSIHVKDTLREGKFSLRK